MTVRRISESTNVANYLVSYLGDLPLNEAQNLEIPFDDEAVKEVQVEGQSKKFVKGARLFLYPKGMQYFRASAGILKPEKYMTTKKRRSKNRNMRMNMNLKLMMITHKKFKLNSICFQKVGRKNK